jgi:hypothetical protein
MNLNTCLPGRLQRPQTVAPAQVGDFLRDGYVMVPNAFARPVAAAIAEMAWEASPFEAADPSTWDRELTVVQQSLKGGPADLLYTPQVVGALDDLLGKGRYNMPSGTGYLVMNLPGFATPPWRTLGEHVDGTHFLHHLDTPEQGLVLLFLYTDQQPQGGGTSICVGSHRVTAQVLADAAPEGLSCGQLSGRVIAAATDLPRIEASGNAGDMLIMHPFTLHGSSSNLSVVPRIAGNVCISLQRPMQFDRQLPDEHSAVEQVVVETLASV